MPVTLTLAGGGEVDGWRAMAGYLGQRDRIRFEGWADAQRLAQLMAQADVLVLPSFDEGLPLAILEALAQGVAVVCTPVGEIPQMLEGGQHAFFVPPGDATALARGLARVLGDERLRCALARNGQALWRQRFSLPRFFAAIAAVHARHFGVAGALAVQARGLADPAAVRAAPASASRAARAPATVRSLGPQG